MQDDSADILKKLFPETTESDHDNDEDEELGYGLQLLDIYESDEEN